MLCNLSMPNAIGLEGAHKAKVTSMPSAMQHNQTCDKMQTSKHAKCNLNIQTCNVIGMRQQYQQQGCDNMQCDKHATTHKPHDRWTYIENG